MQKRSSDPKKKREGKHNPEIDLSQNFIFLFIISDLYFVFWWGITDFDVKFRVDLDWIQVGLIWYVIFLSLIFVGFVSFCLVLNLGFLRKKVDGCEIVVVVSCLPVWAWAGAGWLRWCSVGMAGLRVCEELWAWIWDWGLFFVWVDFWCEGAVGGFVKSSA